ncbi:hypothetical protein [Kineosporia babensis]|uniref:Uncharacterized protein n=1 Tax=Kineosporia babensis TaxID=499548 RepID=A0A9X1SZN3_9ACTN|nr:hypothetical protein [Kineosporia babensis]MCD5312103.1 hypothetical protein [Kineosporia babensis]
MKVIPASSRSLRPPEFRRGYEGGFIDAMGNGLFLPGSLLYLPRAVDLSNAEVTSGLTVAGLVG